MGIGEGEYITDKCMSLEKGLSFPFIVDNALSLSLLSPKI